MRLTDAPLRSFTRHLPAGHTLQGPAAAVARALNDTLIEWELAVERLLDALEPLGPHQRHDYLPRRISVYVSNDSAASA